jgi:hypothetical protein
VRDLWSQVWPQGVEASLASVSSFEIRGPTVCPQLQCWYHLHLALCTRATGCYAWDGAQHCPLPQGLGWKVQKLLRSRSEVAWTARGVPVLCLFLLFVWFLALGFELIAYSLSHSTSPFFVNGSRELFPQAGFEPQSF